MLYAQFVKASTVAAFLFDHEVLKRLQGHPVAVIPQDVVEDALEPPSDVCK